MTGDVHEFLLDLARGAGDILLSNFGSARAVRTKADRGDMVTEVDLKSEEYILKRIRREFPDHNIVSEEAGDTTLSRHSYTWFVDPLDGTRNYAMGIPLFCVSIALARNGELEHGAVYDPLHDEMFHAALGRGAFLNGVELRVSDETDLEDSLVAISWQRRRVSTRKYLRYVRRMDRHSSYYRRLGSAGLMLAYIAAGRMDVYIQGGLSPWDVAAGALLVSEAGGLVTDQQGRPLNLAMSVLEIVAANPALHKATMELILGGAGDVL